MAINGNRDSLPSLTQSPTDAQKKTRRAPGITNPVSTGVTPAPVTPTPTTPVSPAPQAAAAQTNTAVPKQRPKPQIPNTPKIDTTAKRQPRIRKPTGTGKTLSGVGNVRRPSAGLNPVKPATQTQGRRKNNDPWNSEW